MTKTLNDLVRFDERFSSHERPRKWMVPGASWSGASSGYVRESEASKIASPRCDSDNLFQRTSQVSSTCFAFSGLVFMTRYSTLKKRTSTHTLRSRTRENESHLRTVQTTAVSLVLLNNHRVISFRCEKFSLWSSDLFILLSSLAEVRRPFHSADCCIPSVIDSRAPSTTTIWDKATVDPNWLGVKEFE